MEEDSNYIYFLVNRLVHHSLILFQLMLKCFLVRFHTSDQYPISSTFDINIMISYCFIFDIKKYLCLRKIIVLFNTDQLNVFFWGMKLASK